MILFILHLGERSYYKSCRRDVCYAALSILADRKAGIATFGRDTDRDRETPRIRRFDIIRFLPRLRHRSRFRRQAVRCYDAAASAAMHMSDVAVCFTAAIGHAIDDAEIWRLLTNRLDIPLAVEIFLHARC